LEAKHSGLPHRRYSKSQNHRQKAEKSSLCSWPQAPWSSTEPDYPSYIPPVPASDRSYFFATLSIPAYSPFTDPLGNSPLMTNPFFKRMV
jgi:hypothetical protein